ncbi:MAG: oligosaccharide flippase family protein, partial [Anaerolineales bacterium]
VGSVMAYAELFDLGVTGAVVKYMAEHFATGAFDSARRLMATALSLYAALGLALILLALVLAPVFPRVFQVPASEAATASLLVVLMGVLMGLTIAGSITWTVLHGLQRFDLDNLISALTVIVTNIAIVITVQLGGGVIGLVTASIAAAVVMQGFAFWVMLRAAPELSLSLRGARLSEARTIMRFGTALFIGRFAGRLKSRTDEIVIGRMLPVASIAPYAVAHRPGELNQTLTDQFIKVLEPLASQLDAQGDRAGLRALFLTSTRLTLGLFMLVACGLTILSRPFLTLWVGAEYANSPMLVLILMTCALLDTTVTPGVLILQGMARHRPLAAMALASGVVNLVLSIILVQSLGLMGVALGTLIPTALEVGLLVLPYELRTIGVRGRDFLLTACLPALLGAVPLCAWLFAALAWLHPDSWFSLIWIGGVGAAIYGLTYIGLPATGMERRAVQGYARQFMERVNAKS